MSEIALPTSSTTVSVKVFDIATPDSTAPARNFLSPVKPGNNELPIAVYSFLIEHPNGRKMLFDLGVRKDSSNYSPVLQRLLSQGKFNVKVDKDITERLKEGGISLDQIDTVIWSHTHFDGDISLFPPTTKLLLGRGSDRRFFPEFADAKLQESDLTGREIEEISWYDPDLTIGGLSAIDFFGDGSLYLLDTPGVSSLSIQAVCITFTVEQHCPGHVTALARVTNNTFVLLGGDTCHHPGQLRPNVHIQRSFPYLGDLLTDLSKPILTIPEGISAYADRTTALSSLEKIQVLDAHPDILLITAMIRHWKV
ncbi:hypothetical protein D9757_009207 [Collybiopsis confluens]|uniref:Metallo-beta-lactamase domain-containing protein n=1 Tax=Collybiopsis confluens TaxID=2823264 RepID=A0A8H5HA96_9AGAR|nr:hypothetical protein D9757_009207 [Collybiopsis confluens]